MHEHEKSPLGKTTEKTKPNTENAATGVRIHAIQVPYSLVHLPVPFHENDATRLFNCK